VLHKPVNSIILVSVVKRSILRKSARVAPTRMALGSCSEEAVGDWIQTMNERLPALWRPRDTIKGAPVTKSYYKKSTRPSF